MKIPAVAATVDPNAPEYMLPQDRREAQAIKTRGSSLQQILTEKVLHPHHPLSVRCNQLLRTVTDDTTMRVIVAESKEINAAAYPGGLIVVTTGLASKLQYTEEMQALLKHEANHIEKNHSYQRHHIRDERRLLTFIRYNEFESDTAEALQLSERGINPAGALSLHERLLQISNETNEELPINVDFEHGDPELRADTLRELLRIKDLPFLKQSLTREDFAKKIANEFTSPPLEAIAKSSMEEFWIAASAASDKTDVKKCLQTLFSDRYVGVPSIVVPEHLQTRGEDNLHKQLSLFEIANFLESPEYYSIGISAPKTFWIAYIKESIQEIHFGVLSPAEIEETAKNVGRICDALSTDDHNLLPNINSHLLVQYIKTTLEIDSFTGKIGEPSPYVILTHAPDPKQFDQIRDQLAKGARDLGLKTFQIDTLAYALLAETGISALRDLEYKSTELFAAQYLKSLKESSKDREQLNRLAYDFAATKTTFESSYSLPKLIDATNKMAQGIAETYSVVQKNITSPDLQARSTLWVTAASLPADPTVTINTPDSNYVFSRQISRIEALYIDIYQFTYRNVDSTPEVQSIQEGEFFRELLTLAKHELAFYPEETVRQNVAAIASSIQSLYSVYLDSKNIAEKIDQHEISSWSGSSDSLYSLYVNQGAKGVLKVFFLSNVLTIQHPRELIIVLNRTAEEFSHFHADDSSVDDYEDTEIDKARYEFIRECIDLYEELCKTGWPLPKLPIEDYASITEALSGRKQTLLDEFIALTPEKMLSTARERIAEWPMRWPIINREQHEAAWVQISKTMRKWCDDRVEPFTQEELEGFASLLLLSQGSMTAPRATGLLLVQSINCAKSFDEAFRVLERFSFLPLNVLKEPIDALTQNFVRTPDEVRRLRDFVFTRLDTTQIGEILLGLHMSSGVVALGLTDKEKLPLVQHLLTTNKSDEDLLNLTAPQWWRSLPAEAKKKSLGDVGVFAVLADRKAPIPQNKNGVVPVTHPEVQNALVQARQGPSILGIDSFVSFTDSYQQLFSGGTVFNYILLRQLLLSHSKGIGRDLNTQLQRYHPSTMRKVSSEVRYGSEALFDRPEHRLAIFNHLCNHYITGGSGAEVALSSPAVQAVVHALAFGPSSRVLFHNIGPLLAALTAQTPETPARINEIPKPLWENVEKELEKSYSDYARPFRGQDFRYLKAVTKARVLMMLTGAAPLLEIDEEKDTITALPAPQPDYIALEEIAKDQVLNGFPPNRQSSIKGSMSVIELATLVAEHNHAIGRRMLQLYALIKGNTLDDHDRAVVEESFDRSPGMDILRTFDVIDSTSESDPLLATFVDTIEKVEPIKFGGSIFTVPEVTTQSGDKFALHVCNTNAAWHCHEVRNFYRDLIDNLDEEKITPREREVVLYLLDMATEWTLNEIEDPRFIENHEFFTETVNRTQHGSVKFYVPLIRHVETQKVRPQEWFEGKTLTTLTVGESTDIDAGIISEEDGKIIAARIAQQFAQQLFEHGDYARIHSNIHPGNFSLKQAPDGSLIIGILDTKNMLTLDKEERDTLVRCATLFTKGKQAEASQLLFNLILGQSADDRSTLLTSLQAIVQQMKGQPFESIFSAALGTLVERGERPSLKWLLLSQNILGCMYILKRFGWEGSLTDALFFAEDKHGSWRADLKNAEKLYPNAWKVVNDNLSVLEKLGLKFYGNK